MDVHGHQHEVKPLCVLDFYVVEEMQRKGCGKKLFEFMTHDQNVKPQQLAIDRPSAKDRIKNFYPLCYSTILYDNLKFSRTTASLKIIFLSLKSSKVFCENTIAQRTQFPRRTIFVFSMDFFDITKRGGTEIV